jgi:CheY-like chemotaxis protein
MSLVGNLEDLSLPDILQIVSLSRKSGILLLEREGQQGKIIIRQGKVIQTISPRQGRSLGELLTARGLVRPDDLKKALEIQRGGAGSQLLGSILVELGVIDQTSLEKVVTEQIEDAIVFFLSWREGTFSFELAEIKGRGEFSVDPQAFILERGIDTQWLVLEGTRMMDERSRDRSGAAPIAAAPTEAASETSFAGIDDEAAPEGRALILVDDDPLFREMARDNLGRRGFRVVVCDTGAACLAAIEREAGSLVPPAVTTDIVMPTLDNQGFLGGLELVERLRRAHPEVPVVAVTAYPDENVKAQVLEMGGKFLLKPGAADSGGTEDFFAELAFLLGAGDEHPIAAPAPAPAATAQAPPPAPLPPPASAPGKAVAPPAPAAPSAPSPPVAAPRKAEAPPRGQRERAVAALEATRVALLKQEATVAAAALEPTESALLREMLEELQNPRGTSEIGLLILRFAAELLNRAVLFVVKDGKAVGLGGFGVDSGGSEPRGIRGFAIPLTEPSLLESVVRLRAAVKGPLAPSAWNRALLDQLGGADPVDAVALPLISGGRVRVILYGDNLPEQRPAGGTRALELFLARAGLTLEKVLLEKKLQEADAAGVDAGLSKQSVGGAAR